MKWSYLFLIVLGIVLVSGVGSAVAINSCQTLSTTNGQYNLSADIFQSSGDTGNCLIISANNITIDGLGRTIYYANNSAADSEKSAIVFNNRNNITLYNINIVQINESSQNSNGIKVINSTDSKIYNLSVTTNGHSANPIHVLNSNNLNVTQVIIRSLLSEGYQFGTGIILTNTTRSYVDNVNIISTGDQSPAIEIYGYANNTLIINSILNTTNDDGYGIDMQPYCVYNDEQQYNNFIVNNTIYTYGQTSDGIRVQCNPYAFIANNTIGYTTSSGFYVVGNKADDYNITLGEDNKVGNKVVNYTWGISNVVIDGTNYNSKGQIVLSNITKITLSNLFSNGSLSLFDLDNSIFNNITINVTAGIGYGIRLEYYNTTNNIFNNITIQTLSDNSHAIFLNFGDFNNTFQYGSILTYGDRSRPIYSNGEQYFNNLYVEASGYSTEGIRSGRYVFNSIIKTKRDSCPALYSTVRAINNTIVVFGNDSKGIDEPYLSDSKEYVGNNITLYSYKNTYGLYGIFIYGSDNNTINNNIVNIPYICDSGIRITNYFGNRAINNSLKQNVINANCSMYNIDSTYSNLFDDVVYLNITIKGNYVKTQLNERYWKNVNTVSGKLFGVTTTSPRIYNSTLSSGTIITNQEANLTLAPNKEVYISDASWS